MWINKFKPSTGHWARAVNLTWKPSEEKENNSILIDHDCCLKESHLNVHPLPSSSASLLVIEGSKKEEWKRKENREWETPKSGQIERTAEFNSNKTSKCSNVFCLPASCKAVLPCRSTFPTGQLCWNTKHWSDTVRQFKTLQLLSFKKVEDEIKLSKTSLMTDGKIWT